MRLDYKVSYREKDKSIQCIIAYKDNGKWKTRSKQGFKRQMDYKDWIDDTLDELKEIVKVPADFRGINFGEFKKVFLEDRKELAYNSRRGYLRAYKKFEKLDPLPLSEISYFYVKPCVDAMIKEGLKNSTITNYLSQIATTLNHAIENYEIIKENPIKIDKYKLPIEETNVESSKIKALNQHELEDLLLKLKGKDYYISLLASKCGLRLGEILGIVDSVIDFKNRELKVLRQWKQIGDYKYGLGTLKTNNSYRTVPIPVNYIPELQEYIKTCVKDLNGRIFIDRMTDTTSSRLAQKYKRLGYDISVHDLRHTYATTLLANGFDYKTVAEFMGDTVEMVIRTYSHFTDDMLKIAKTRIDNIL